MSSVEPLRPVVKTTLTEQVMQRLMEHMQGGPLQPGDALPSQVALAQQLGVSRPVLREAMQRLVSIGMLEIRPGSGCYVGTRRFTPDADTLFEMVTHEAALETVEARLVVEVELAGLAAQRGRERDWQVLSAILGRLQQAAAEESETSHITSEFHRELARAGHNSVLFKMSQLLSRARAAQGVRIERALPDVSAGEYGSHLRLYEAVRSGDSEVARREMRHHLEIAHGWEERVSALKRRISEEPTRAS